MRYEQYLPWRLLILLKLQQISTTFMLASIGNPLAKPLSESIQTYSRIYFSKFLKSIFFRIQWSWVSIISKLGIKRATYVIWFILFSCHQTELHVCHTFAYSPLKLINLTIRCAVFLGMLKLLLSYHHLKRM